MASLVTLADLKTKCRRQCDMEFSSFISDLELVDYINDSATSLYDMLIQAGELYKIDSTSITIIPGQSLYALPATFYKMLGVDFNTNGQTVSMKRFEFGERNKFTGAGFLNSTGVVPMMYLVQGDSIKFIPDPSNTDTITVWFAPIMPKLVLDTDTFDSVNGFENYIVYDVCIKMLSKEESDIQPFLLMKQDAERRIQKMKLTRDHGGRHRVSDVAEGQFYLKSGGYN